METGEETERIWMGTDRRRHSAGDGTGGDGEGRGSGREIRG